VNDAIENGVGKGGLADDLHLELLDDLHEIPPLAGGDRKQLPPSSGGTAILICSSTTSGTSSGRGLMSWSLWRVDFKVRFDSVL
jgi:hypothetical protein